MFPASRSRASRSQANDHRPVPGRAADDHRPRPASTPGLQTRIRDPRRSPQRPRRRAVAEDILARFTKVQDGYRARVGQRQIAKWREQLDQAAKELVAEGAGPLLDPDCRDGKCGSCTGPPCEHECHQPRHAHNFQMITGGMACACGEKIT
jgi:hypothetical protein